MRFQASDIPVVYRDAHLLVVDKPPGLPTTANDGKLCLTQLVGAIDPKAPRLHPSSRLDSDASGLVTFARTRLATRALLEARRTGRYLRGYLALSVGHAETPAGHWNWPIGLHPTQARMRQAVPDGGTLRGQRAASTLYTTLAAPHAAPIRVLWLQPQTGRTHQLRVHAARAGLPLLGDPLYDGARRLVLPDGRVATARRTLLHCARIRVPDPNSKRSARTLEWRAPLPDDLLRVWTSLGHEAAELREILDNASLG